MIKTPNAGSTYRGGILGRRKRLTHQTSDAPSTPQKTELSECTQSRKRPVVAHVAAAWPMTPPEHPTPAKQARYERELIAAIIARTSPVLIDREEALIALDLTPGVLDRWVREGVLLEDMASTGTRQMFLASTVRALILKARARGNVTTLDPASGPPAANGPPAAPDPSRAGVVLYPVFVRQLSPDVERLVQPDLVTGRWPQLPNLSPAKIEEKERAEYLAVTGHRLSREPGLREWELRKPIAWKDKPPSRSAFNGYLTDSRAAVEEALEEQAERKETAAEPEPELAEAAE